MSKPNAHPGSCRGRYHTGRQPFTLQCTARCPGGTPATRANPGTGYLAASIVTSTA
jgi:hypothetical protein